MEGLDILFVDVRDDPLDADLDNNLLVDKAHPYVQLLLLKLEEVYALRFCCDFRVDEFGYFNAAAVKVVVVGENPDIVLAEYEREIPVVPPPPRRGRKESC